MFTNQNNWFSDFHNNVNLNKNSKINILYKYNKKYLEFTSTSTETSHATRIHIYVCIFICYFIQRWNVHVNSIYYLFIIEKKLKVKKVLKKKNETPSFKLDFDRITNRIFLYGKEFLTICSKFKSLFLFFEELLSF